MDKQCGVTSPMVHGLGAKKTGQPTPQFNRHAIEVSEEQFWQRKEQAEFSLLRNVYGIHAPLKLKMEREIVKKNGHLPFLRKHNVSLDVLTGRDEMITFDDFLGHPHEPEQMGQPHAILENLKK